MRSNDNAVPSSIPPFQLLPTHIIPGRPPSKPLDIPRRYEQFLMRWMQGKTLPEKMYRVYSVLSPPGYLCKEDFPSMTSHELLGAAETGDLLLEFKETPIHDAIRSVTGDWSRTNHISVVVRHNTLLKGAWALGVALTVPEGRAISITDAVGSKTSPPGLYMIELRDFLEDRRKHGIKLTYRKLGMRSAASNALKPLLESANLLILEKVFNYIIAVQPRLPSMDIDFKIFASHWLAMPNRTWPLSQQNCSELVYNVLRESGILSDDPRLPLEWIWSEHFTQGNNIETWLQPTFGFSQEVYVDLASEVGVSQLQSHIPPLNMTDIHQALLGATSSHSPSRDDALLFTVPSRVANGPIVKARL